MSVQASGINWPALIAALAKAQKDIRANRPLAPAPEMTGAAIAAALPAIQADLAWIAGKLKDYPGAIRGLDDILLALEADAPWVAQIKEALDALPGGLAAAQSWLPTVLWGLTEFAPVPGKFIGIIP